jgi:hypothetical protein
VRGSGGHNELPVNTQVFVPRDAGKPLNPPHGGVLVNLVPSPEVQEQRKRAAASLPSLTLTDRQLCDIELIMNGGFSPLNQWMTRAVYENVVQNMRLGPAFKSGQRVRDRLRVGLRLANLRCDRIRRVGEVDPAHVGRVGL